MADSLSEKKEIRNFSGKAQKNSGRGQYQKGDATLGPFTVDVKEYLNTFGLSKKMWGKVCTDAQQNGNMPALMVALGEGRETVRLWVIGDTMFKEMLASWEKEYGG